MKVYLTNTPEFSSDKVDEVIAILQEIPGELKFERGKPLSQAQYKRIDKRFEDSSEIKSLKFKEYFNLIEGYRDFRNEINEQDFVILITSIRHDRNWFSGFQNRDIFVHGDEWDIISDVDSKYGIAYQCVENIFQSLMGLDIMNYKKEPNIHKETIGCINDFCGKKTDILRKFQSGNICNTCLYVAEFEKGVDKYIIMHIIHIIEEIRKEFVVSKHLRSITKFEKVKVDSDGNIFIGDRPLKLDILPKVLYIGFLKHLEGVQSNKLCENRDIFERIYHKVKSNREPDPDAIRNMVCKKTEIEHPKVYHKPTFETYRSKVKGALVNVLGETLTNYYHVNYVEDNNHHMLFKVPLSNDFIDIDVNFLK